MHLMKAAVLRQIQKPLEIEDVDVPALNPDEVLVKTQACGICRTDLHFLQGEMKAGKLPLILGHEASGTVESCGTNVEGWEKGDRVIPYRDFTCGKCYSCTTGHEEVCYSPLGKLGFNRDGGFAEYFKAPARFLIRLPETVTFQDGGTVTCAGQTAYHAIKTRAHAGLGQTLMVLGAGGIGLQVLQYAKVAGASVLVADRSGRKLEFASKFGPDHLIDLTSHDIPSEVKRLTDGRGADIVVDTTASGKVIGVGLASLRKAGRMVLLGASEDPIPSITCSNMLATEHEVLGSRSSTKKELTEATALVASGKIKSIVTETYKLEQINEALERLRRGAVLGRAALIF